MSNPLAEATSKLLDILSPLNTEERARVVQATLTLLGDDTVVRARPVAGAKPEADDVDDDGSLPGLSAPAKVWARKHGLSLDALQHHFDIGPGKALPIGLPGRATKKVDQAVSTYLIQGLSAFLVTGDPSFTDDDARKLCTHFGCYDSTNHAKYLKDLGNRVTGSKSAGWKLTVPGLAAAADLLRG